MPGRRTDKSSDKIAYASPAPRLGKPFDPRPLLPAIFLVGIYILLLIFGSVILCGDGVMVGGNEMSAPRAIFTAVNAITLTGFRQSIALDQILPRGQICIAVLMHCGTFITLVVSSLAVVKLLRLKWTIGQIALAAIIAQAVSAIVGGAMMLTADRTVAAAIFQASSAFDNCGLLLGTAPGEHDLRTLLVLIPLSVLGGLGLPVLIDLFASGFAREKRPLSIHTQTVLSMTAMVFLAGVALSVLSAWPNAARDALDGLLKTSFAREHYGPLADALGKSLVATLNARSAGLPVQEVYSLPREMQWIMMLLMSIGAASAGTGGGIKVNTLFVIFRGGNRALHNQNPGRMFGVAISWLGIFFALVCLTQLWLLQAQPELSADRALFVAISAAANVGLSHDPLSITRQNAFLLSTTMLLGRLLPIIVLWWSSMTIDDADIAVG